MGVEADLVSSRASGTEADRMQNCLGILGHESESLSLEIVPCSANRHVIIARLQQDVSKTFAGKVGAQHYELAMVKTLDAGVGKDSAFQIFPSCLSVRIPVWPDLFGVLLFGDSACVCVLTRSPVRGGFAKNAISIAGQSPPPPRGCSY